MATATAFEKRRIHKDTGIEYGLADGQWQPIVLDRSESVRPMANFHAARVHDPDEYDHFATCDSSTKGFDWLSEGVHVILGFKKGGSSEPQAYRFDKAKFTEPRAREWLKAHKIEAKTFEPARADESKQRSDSAQAGELRVRSAPVLTSSWDDATRSARVTIATDAPVFSTEVRTGRPVHEVWLMSGLVFDPHVPLLDTHDRSSTDKMKGRVEQFQPGSHDCDARLFVSEAEPATAIKIKDGTIREVSAGGVPLETTTIPAGQSRTIDGREFTARDDQPLYVHTKFRIREVSLTAKGADPGASIRSFSEENSMKARMRKWLQRIGLDKDATDEKAQKFHDALPEETRAKCRAYTEKDEDDEEDKEDEERAAKARKAADDKAEAERRANADADRIRKEAADAAVKAERDRVARIRESGAGLPEEVVRKALDDHMSIEAAGAMFLKAYQERTPGIAPYQQSRGLEKDLTRDVLGTALVIRSLNSLESGKPGATFASNPTNLLGRYRPSQFARAGIGDWQPDYPTRDLTEDARKRNEQLLNQADRFRNLSLVDICRHCCRLDGVNVDGFASPSEVIGAAMEGVVRAGPSGGSFGAIFTTNFNALFLAGYLEATDTTLGWCTEGDAPNFMPGELVMVGKMGNLTLDGKGRPDEMTYGDWNEKIKVNRFSGMFEVDEKDLINDRFGALQTNSPQELGLSARRLRPNLIYSMLLGSYTAGTGRGPTLNQDSAQLFNATATTTTGGHANFLTAANNDLYTASTGAIGTAGLQKLIPAIQSQRLGGIALNLVPRFVIISPWLDMAIRVALFSTQRIVASGSGGTLNPLQMFNLEPRVDARMDDIGSVDPLNANKTVVGLRYHYLLACRPGENGAKTVHVNYLLGQGRAPQIRSYVLGGPGAPGRWGIGWDVKLDIGAAVADFRGLAYAESST